MRGVKTSAPASVNFALNQFLKHQLKTLLQTQKLASVMKKSAPTLPPSSVLQRILKLAVVFIEH